MSGMAWLYAAAASPPPVPGGAESAGLVDSISKLVDSIAGLVTAFGSLAGLLAAVGAVVALRRGSVGQKPKRRGHGNGPPGTGNP